MIDKNEKIVPPHQGEENPNPKILALGKKITDVLDHKLKGLTSNDPEYWGLAGLVTDEMADVALKMKIRHHYTLSEMAKMNHIEEKDLPAFKALLDQMLDVGILEFDEGNHYDHNGRIAPIGERRYCLGLFVPGSAEMVNMHEDPVTGEDKKVAQHPEVAPFFERMTYIPLDGITQMVPPGGSGIGMHVIPVEKAISMENQTSDLEHLSYWLKKYQDKIGVGPCSCRASRAQMGEGVPDDYQGWCIGVGDFADYCRETGKGHDITYEQALEILKKAEDNGFVHQITNIDGENKIFGICNCNVNICNALRTSQLFNTPNMSRSAYTAKVDPNNCIACGKCVESCPAGAVKLGQKLCTKVGEVVYPRHQLPDATKWTKDKYDPDYRNNNRINCYDTGTAPCKASCPAHIAIQGYMKLAKLGKYQEALALIKKDNPFPAICGRVCNKLCEQNCTRGDIDKPVSIDAIKKFIAELDLHQETRYIPPIIMPVSPARLNPLDHYEEKIAIIGGGPAGLSCAYYLATLGYKPTVFEKSALPGGMMQYGIPSYKLEKDVIKAEIDILLALGVQIKCGVEVGKDITIPELRKQGYLAFYVAIGCQGGNIPNVKGNDAKGIEIAVDFLHSVYENHGREIKDHVVVVGGGNVAIDCARTAHRLKAKNVTMVCLESFEGMPASKDEISEALEENIKIKNGYGPKEIIKDEDGNVKEIIFKKCLRTIDPQTGKFDPLYEEDDTMIIKADTIIFAIGQKVIWNDLLKDTQVKFHHGSYPIADPLTYQTDEEDIFVGGDVYTGPKFVIDAIAAGHKASDSLHRYVHKGASLTIGKDTREFISLDKTIVKYPEYKRLPRQEASYDEDIDRKTSFRDASGVLSEEQVKKEVSRCLGCGLSIVDPNKCIGCGICTTRCQFDAIHLFRDHGEQTHMVRTEDKFKYILPYQLKRALKIMVSYKSKEEKKYEKSYQEFRQKLSALKEENK